MSGLGVVHVVYNALRDHPGRYTYCSHGRSELFGSEFREMYRYVQKVFENDVHCRLFAMDWGTPASDIGLVHLLYETLRHLPVRYYLCTHSLSELFGSGFGELYRYVQKVYENAVRDRL